ncbi:MAG: hypothetical protein FJ215_06355 [Ignavibacteria bacterium]|nr:hypothetical protein [Ignavibacteria bacterium]
MSDQKLSAEERNKRVSTLLHQVDELVKQGNLDAALEKSAGRCSSRNGKRRIATVPKHTGR